MKKSTVFTQIVIVVAILIIINLISNTLYFRLDFTEDQRYTLSNATKNVLNELDEVITVKAYFTKDLPSQLAYVRNDLRDQLVEYEDRSSGNIVFEFVDPSENDELKQEALQNGVAPISINVVEDDQRQQIQAFLGVVFQAGDEKEVIPLVQPGASMEYDITRAIKKLSIQDKPKVAYITGFGEPSLAELPQLQEQLSVLYDVEALQLSDTAEIPSFYKSILWVGPRDTISQLDFAKVDRYIQQGGNLFVAYSNLQGDLQTSQLSKAPEIGITRWLSQKGVQMDPKFVVDAECATVTVQQRTGFYTINSQIEFPYFPQVTNFGDHPVTNGLEGLIFQFVSPLKLMAPDTSVKIMPLLYSSEVSGTRTPPVYIDIQKKWTQSDFNSSRQILAAAVINPGQAGRIVIVPNSSFIINGSGQQMQQLNPDNVSFASNAIDWLADDTGLIELRTKGITNRPLEAVEDTQREVLKYANLLIPIILIVIYGILRKGIRARKRQKWMQGNFDV